MQQWLISNLVQTKESKDHVYLKVFVQLSQIAAVGHPLELVVLCGIVKLSEMTGGYKRGLSWWGLVNRCCDIVI